MKKYLSLLAIFAAAVFLTAVMASTEGRAAYFSADEEGELVLSVRCEGIREDILPYYEEETGISWFLMPSFVKENTVYRDRRTSDIIADGKPLSWLRGLCWEEGTVYDIRWGENVFRAGFMRSENLPSIFIETESGSLAYLNENKRNREKGYIKVIESTGNLEYQGALAKISERGNSTFSAEKKSFSLTLQKKQPLCGLEAGKKWNLLSLYFEQNKIQSKIVYGMADHLGLDYTPGCTWVDLYCNGSYEGLYLLTEAVTVGEGRVEIHDLDADNKAANQKTDWQALEVIREERYSYHDIESPPNISGGYLIEKERSDRVEDDEIFFKTDAGFSFVIKEPQSVSREEIEYISGYVQEVEDLIMAEDTGYKKYIDEDSFAKQFLIDKIVLEADALSVSTFFYLDRDSVVLRSGPLWDYDRAFGLILTDHTGEIEDYPGELNRWYTRLYYEQGFKENMLDQFRRLLPYIKELLDTGIERYTRHIASSLKMDQCRWGQTGAETRIYESYDSHVRYLKHFLYKRTGFLIEKWNISYDLGDYADLCTEEFHTVTLMKEDGSVLAQWQVRDGDYISQAQEFDRYSENGVGWHFKGRDLPHTSMIPVFEDMVLIENDR